MRRTAPTDAAEDMDKLREDAASLLLRAAEDGTLEAVLSSRVKVQKVRGFGWRSKCVGIHMGCTSTISACWGYEPVRYNKIGLFEGHL